MMPAFLRWLRDNQYRVVHVVPLRPAAGGRWRIHATR